LPGVPAAKDASGFTCPREAPIHAYSRGRLYYLPNHPHLPAPDVAPARCYPSIFDAKAAGYSEAALPAGAAKVDGVYLVPVDLTAQCRAAARALGFGVPCPFRLPNPQRGNPAPGCNVPLVPPSLRTDPPCVLAGKAFFLQELHFAIPPNFAPGGLAQAEGDAFVLGMGPGTSKTDPSLAGMLSCQGAEDRGSTPIAFNAQPVKELGQLVFCPASNPQPLGGSLLIQWTVNGSEFWAGLAGDSDAHRTALRAIAASTRLVPPG
jgi:hypothetical protein